jgi:hypothetical protein
MANTPNSVCLECVRLGEHIPQADRQVAINSNRHGVRTEHIISTKLPGAYCSCRKCKLGDVCVDGLETLASDVMRLCERPTA